jgi:hypothetical protein
VRRDIQSRYSQPLSPNAPAIRNIHSGFSLVKNARAAVAIVIVVASQL